MAGFNEKAYLDANPDVAAAVKAGVYATGWQHFISTGSVEGRALAPASVTVGGVTKNYTDFKEYAYFANSANYDVDLAVKAGTYKSGWDHYSQKGIAEGRSEQFPPTGYSEEKYLAANPDVAKAVHLGTSALYLSGLEHYVRNGLAEGRTLAPANYTVGAVSGGAAFDEQAYLAANPDVAVAVKNGVYGTGWEHYLAKVVGGAHEVRSLAPTGYDLLKAVTVGAVGSDNASGFNTTYNVSAGTYTYTVNKFAAGDVLKFFTGAALNVVPDTDNTDGIQDITASDAASGTTVTIHLIGITAAQDAAIFNVPSLSSASVFGAGAIL
jgi:hypothetical protein